MARSRTLLVALATASLGLLAGCDQVAEQVSGPDPEAAAEALVAALAAGDLGEAPVADPARAERSRAEVVAGLGDVAPEVGLLDLEEADRTATATLSWTWPLGRGGGTAWTYESTAGLVLEEGSDGEEWVAQWAPSVVEPSLSEDEVLDATTLLAGRGDVVGARGLAVVTERPVVRYGIDKSAVGDRRALVGARRLAQLVDVDVQPYVDRVEAGGDQAFVEAITYRRDEVPVPVVRGYEPIPGVLAVGGELPLAPTRDFAAPVLGSVGPVTAEMVEEQPEVYAAGDVAGLSGLQARYDEQLRGVPGVLVEAAPAEGAEGKRREVFRADATAGEDLRLTLDVDLQAEAEAVLEGVGPASALVALDPRSGAVLAAANGEGTGGTNLATYGQAAPGSTFKTVSSLALLRAGLDPTSAVDCPATTTVDGKEFGNYSDYPASSLGRIPLREAVAQSCNTAFITARDRLGDGDLAAAAASLGLGVDHEVGFPAYFGQVPDPETETEAAADLIGQGRVLASPMAMAAVMASVQSGRTVVPWLVEGERSDPPADAEPLTRGEAGALRAMLRAVVTEGSGRLLADVPGPALVAKTGTAEFERDGEVLTHAWMVAAGRDLAVAVYVDEGVSGSRTAGPLLEAFLRAARG